MSKIDPYAPATTYATLPTPRRLAKNGYVAYLAEGAPSNAASTHAGEGATPTDAIRASCYWANQLPWVRVVPWSRAPQWAIDSANEAGRAHPS